MSARQAELEGLLGSAQQVAALVAARGRGDVEGARQLTRHLVTEGDLAGGALLVAELALGLLAEAGDESLDAVVGRLNLELMALPRRSD
ncbi:hypothetical protein RDV89_17855 [Nocardioides zeae]|uniref:ANTAR domain-containing protein n=1 Tax=Nocardioides imazamoxiresistens TaxID=3231893 RepID=A0ABU3Q0A5_9ACTN|nr:hypothetical protein [Nocardioides zeae]MDT9594958.1 hypothetical protein [Nocardioides zeae]